MARRNNIFHIASRLIVAMLALFISSCQLRPLEEPDYRTRINVEIDVEAISNLTCDIYNDKIPIQEIDYEVMRLMFYDNKKNFLFEQFISEKRVTEDGAISFYGEIPILPGDYMMQIYSFGAESTLVGNYNSYDECYAYTNYLSEELINKLNIKAPEIPNKIMYQPDYMHVVASDEINIPFHADVYTIEEIATPAIQSYYLQIKVEGLEYVSTATAIMGSMSSGFAFPIKSMFIDKSDALYIPLLKSDDKGVPVICNVFNTFGRVPESTNELFVNFDVRTQDGRQITETFDITHLFYTEDAIERHWLLLDETIVVPPPDKPSSGGGFDPAVEDWDDVVHDIIL